VVVAAAALVVRVVLEKLSLPQFLDLEIFKPVAVVAEVVHEEMFNVKQMPRGVG
jgi:hypothetical protein